MNMQIHTPSVDNAEELTDQVIRLQECTYKLAQWAGIDPIDLEDEGMLEGDDTNIVKGVTWIKKGEHNG